MQALSQREQFATEPQVGDPQTYYGPNGEQVEATPVVLDDGRTLLRTLNGQLLNGLNFTSEERLQNTSVKAKDIPARFPDGTTGTAYNVPGMIGLQIVNDQGEYEPAPRGTTELTSATQTPQRTRGSTDQDWTTQVNVTQELVDTSSRIKSILDEEGANVIGFLGSTNRFFASLGAQSKALLQQATVFDEETGQNLELDIENFRESFPASLADQSQRIQTNALRLAYLVAKSSDPSGRVSDADFRAALQRIGGSTGNPSAFVAALQEETRNAVLSAARNSENFLEEGVNPSQFVNQFLEGRFVNTDILSGMDFLQSDSGNGQNGAPEEVSMEEVINNATETKVLQGTTYYKYQGDWYGE